MMLASEIIDACAAHYGTYPVLIRTEVRGTVKIAAARQMAMYLTHTLSNYSAAKIGRLFGRDQSTVWHAFNLVKAKHTPAELGDIAEAIIDRVAAGRVRRTEGVRNVHA